MSDLRTLLAKVADGNALTRAEAATAFDVLMSGDATPSQIGAFLMGLRVRGETVEEIAGAVEVMRAKMVPVRAPEGAVDIVGTGGDGSGSYNISTCAAFIVAGCGVPVAKHGNRALSSRSGAADVLAALGVNLDLRPSGISRCIDEAGIGFMFAPAHHAAMKHVGPTRVELGVRTIFNILGPLSNPAGVKRLLLGVYHPRWLDPLANALAALGAERALVVHGADGLDEISTTGPTAIAALIDGAVVRYDIDPETFGLPRVSLADLKGGDAVTNADALTGVLAGVAGPYRDIACLNAAGALFAAGAADTLAEGLAMAGRSIDTGAARTRLDRLVAVSQRAAD